ncbi:C-type lectin domain family 14 member A [Hemicordylus capensis]|uniref:C-type lectin domain family 14 member A n=1 Tax=Hemicordylus capensis TaxID=884348 RepID=UPI002303F531|nr:C-type lectin domain family 14 member A [Hemicordylus capensis]
MTGRILAPLVLQLFTVLRGSAEPAQSDRAWCHRSGACYSVHVASLNFNEAQEACHQRGGGLSTASGEAELEAIFALLRGLARETGTSSFWLGLLRKPPQCTRRDLPLRGFSWASAWPQEVSANGTMETPYWVKEPAMSCLKLRCAGLHMAAAAASGEQPVQRWGLKDHSCNHVNPGFICKYYRSEAGCPALHAPGARNLTSVLPYQVQSTALEFSPPGTVLTLACPTREARFTCRLLLDGVGYQWEGTADRLCSCSSGNWSLSKAGCVEPAGCVGAQGVFLCLCAWGSRLAAEVKSCWRAESGITAGTPGLLLLPAQNSSLPEPFPDVVVRISNSSIPAEDETLLAPDSSSYVLIILITLAVVILLILIMVALQCCQSCYKSCSSKGSLPVKDGVLVAAKEGDPEASATRTNSVHSLVGPSKEESAEASSEGDLESLDGKVEMEQAQADLGYSLAKTD